MIALLKFRLAASFQHSQKKPFLSLILTEDGAKIPPGGSISALPKKAFLIADPYRRWC